MTRQIVRDWAVRINALGPDGLTDRKPPCLPSKFNDTHRAALVAAMEQRPIPVIHEVVRRRLVNLIQRVWDEFRMPISKQTLSRDIRALGYRKLSARRRHYAKDGTQVTVSKKPFVCRKSRQVRPVASRMRSGTVTRPGSVRTIKITCRWA